MAMALAAAFLPLAPALAQTPAQSPSLAPISASDSAILLELNGAHPNEQGGCRLTVIAGNRLEQGLERAAWQVAIFDGSGRVQSLPVLDFGQLIGGKTKVAIFDLPDQPCDNVGRIIVNDVAECRGDEGSDLRDICLTGLATRSLADIDFGI